MDAQDLVDGGGQQRRVAPQAVLQRRPLGQVLGQDADAGGHGGELAHRPVAHDADDLLVAQQAALHFLAQQSGGDVVGGLVARRAPQLELGADVAVELERHCRRGVALARQRGGAVPVRPLAQRLVQRCRPAHEGTLRLQREVLGEPLHQLDLAVVGQAAHELGDDAAAHRLELGHRPRAEIGLDQLAIRRVRGWVHAVGHGRVARHRVAEGLVVGERPHHVRMAEQRPVQVLAVRHRAALAQVVVGADLVGEHGRRAGVPVGLRSMPGCGRVPGFCAVHVAVPAWAGVPPIKVE